MAMEANQPITPTEILKRPYHRVIVPEEEGLYSALISEFPGCLAIGNTVTEAYIHLEEAAEGWLLAAIDNKRPIPEPIEDPEYSGKLALRLPKSLHETAANAAERDGVSLNQYIVTAIAKYTGEQVAKKPVLLTATTYNFFHLATLPGQPVMFVGSSQPVFASGVEWTKPIKSLIGNSQD
jgi:antitoxin HicB